MSNWVHIIGTIRVHPMGRCDNEREYILKQVLNHLPRVTGSEGDMDIYITKDRNHNISSNCDEYGQFSNLKHGDDSYGYNYFDSFRGTDNFYLTVIANLRDRNLKITNREFQKWLCRLAKRVPVRNICIKIEEDCTGETLFLTDAEKYNICEIPSWNKDKYEDVDSNWCEHLMWDCYEESWMPLKLVEKYYDIEGEYDEENDEN